MTVPLSVIVARRGRGESLAVIGADLGVTRQAVHDRLRRAGLTSSPDWAAHRAALVADMELMVSSRESPDRVVDRLGYASRESLARALRRAGRPDLARYAESGTATPHPA